MMRHSVQLSRWPRNIEKDLALRSPIGIYSDKVFYFFNVSVSFFISLVKSVIVIKGLSLDIE